MTIHFSLPTDILKSSSSEVAFTSVDFIVFIFLQILDKTSLDKVPFKVGLLNL